jgi:carbamoyl-phosphate synthase large subunit
VGTKITATGEVMAIDRGFERALLKAVNSLEIDHEDLMITALQEASSSELQALAKEQTDERLFVLFEMMRRGVSIHEIHELTKIDLFFLHRFKKLIDLEKQITDTNYEMVTNSQLKLFKEKGFSDYFLATQWKVSEVDIRMKRKAENILPAFKMVDTCAAEFTSVSNYYYSSYHGENEQIPSNKQKVLIIGSGPIRIGQGIEFDYCSVHGVMALKEENIETIMINNNPETVSTDFATADRLYFEPLTFESIVNVIEAEQISDVIVQLGGQTALNLAKELEGYGVNLLGTSSETIDLLEDRDRFYQLLDKLAIPRVKGDIAVNQSELFAAIETIGYPVLIRPSYVIGGKGMHVIKNQQELRDVLDSGTVTYPILVDQYLYAKEAELDLVADGENVFVPTIMEHIEKTGVHSGDSLSILPAKSFSKHVENLMTEYARRIVKEISYKGVMNVQFIIDEENVLVLEVNPRASRTVPIVSKVTGQLLVQIATKILLGKLSLSNELEVPFNDSMPFTCIKYPVFSNYALKGLDSIVGPEMKSTGEGISLAGSYEEALAKWVHTNLGKDVQGGKIVCSHLEDLNDLEVLARKVNIELVQTDQFESELADKKTIAFYNTQKLDADVVSRQNATRNRIVTFTHKETLMAFLTALTVNSWQVQSIEKWHQTIKKDVNVG